jgi:cytoskeletal protein CcmA (bactofilin family)
MFRKRSAPPTATASTPAPTERVTSVLSTGITWKGQLGGSGGVRIEGTFEGDIALRGMVVIGETGRVSCQSLHANTVIVAGMVRGDITAERLEIRSTGRVWGNVVTASFATEEGAFLRGQITMEERVEVGAVVVPASTPEHDKLADQEVPGQGDRGGQQEGEGFRQA